jgi:hypothetical protein
MREVQEMARREITRAMVDAARAEKLALHAEGVAFLSDPQLSVVSAPVAGLDKIDFGSLVGGGSTLDNAPLMYWYLAGEAIEAERFPFGEGFYTVVAHQERGSVSLRASDGDTVAKGNLEVCIEPPQSPTTAELSIGGGFTDTEVNLKKHHVKICGFVTVSYLGVEVKVSGCIAVDW